MRLLPRAAKAGTQPRAGEQIFLALLTPPAVLCTLCALCVLRLPPQKPWHPMNFRNRVSEQAPGSGLSAGCRPALLSSAARGPRPAALRLLAPFPALQCATCTTWEEPPLSPQSSSILAQNPSLSCKARARSLRPAGARVGGGAGAL